ncbi:hypothetical protein FB451DRAFT_1451759 [Mycena latifolia]|nr:hypothetical protein FB451DRAFT_1451759 [Mycena latifolia]
MSARSRRTQSSARPGEIITNAQQKRRSPEEKAADELAKEQAKASKEQAAIDKHHTAVQRVADKEDALRLEDEHTRVHSARPDLLTAEVKRKAANASKETDVVMHGASDEGSDEYRPEDASDDGGAASDEEALQQFLKERAALKTSKKKKAAKPAKPAKGMLRLEIQGAGRVAVPVESERSLKRKPSGRDADVESKKMKATVGGLKKGWEKEVGIVQKKSIARGRATSISSAVSMASTFSSRASSRNSIGSMGEDQGTPGEFENDETQAALQAARVSKTANAMVNATAKMGISLVPKDIALDVNGKVKREPKPKYTNSDLPFPQNGFANDLKYWQSTAIPDIIDWAGIHDDAFAVIAHPEFREVVGNIWAKYFSAYEITEAVYAMAAAAIRNWRSKIGKGGLKALEEIITREEYPTLDIRADYAHDRLIDSAFVYENEESETGAYRSELMLRTFAAHVAYLLKTDISYGDPIGAMAISCAAAERALHMYKTGKCSADGLKRKGKRSAQSFVAVPWAARAKAYLPGIKSITAHKWNKIIALSTPYVDTNSPIGGDDSEWDESEDSRGLIQLSDDSDEEPPEYMVAVAAA